MQTSSFIQPFLNQVGAQNLTKQAGAESLLVFGGLLDCVRAPHFSRYYDFAFGPMVFVARPGYGDIFFDLSPYGRCRDAFFARYREQSQKTAELIDYEHLAKQVTELHRDHLSKDLSKIDLEDLVEMNQQTFNLTASQFAPTIFSEPIDESFVKDEYTKMNLPLENFAEFLEHCTTATSLSFIQRGLTEALSTDQNNADEKRYVLADYWSALPKEGAAEKLAQLIAENGGAEQARNKLAAATEEQATNRSDLEKFRAELDESARQLLDFVQLGIKIRDERKIPFNQLAVIYCDLTREIFRHRDIDPELIPYAHCDDFSAGLALLDDYPATIERRSTEGCTLLSSDDGNQIEYGYAEEDERFILQAMNGQSDGQPVTEIKGQAASRGQVRGRVQVIRGQSDFERFETGNILVTSMTRPEFVPLMKRAIAIITDEGGITCHAAIVSRELGLPCVIGTKNATSILKDGQEVEVDADHGLVKIIVS